MWNAAGCPDERSLVVVAAASARIEPARSRAALAVLGCLFLALAAGIGSTWVDDGDGTCGAVYTPNLERMGCARKLAPMVFASALGVGGAVIAWDAARHRGGRPRAGAVLSVTIGLVAVCIFLVANGALNGLGRADRGPRPSAPPTTGPPVAPPPDVPSPTIPPR
jgi:hypothetical protein